MEIRTTACSLKGHPEIVLRFDEESVPEIDAKWLASFLESAVSEGRRFQPSETLQIGWTVNKIGQSSAGSLTLLEPVLGTQPIVFVDSVTGTLLHLRQERDVAESFSPTIEPVFASMRQSALACRNLIISQAGVMARDEPGGTDSGWFFGCDDQDHDHNEPANLVRVSLFQVGSQNPALIKYLALPAGTVIRDLTAARPRFFLSGRQQQIVSGSYLDQLCSRG